MQAKGRQTANRSVSHDSTYVETVRLICRKMMAHFQFVSDATITQRTRSRVSGSDCARDAIAVKFAQFSSCDGAVGPAIRRN